MEECCVVCAEPLEWVGYGVCGHRDVCSTCVARLRVVLNDRCCCICKQECTSVFMTKALGDYTKVIKDFQGLQACGDFWYDSNTQAYFDDKDHYTMIKAMCCLSCQICEQAEGMKNSTDFVKKGNAFNTLDLLVRHITIVHKMQMCSLCLEGRKAFICEQKLYSKAQLERHLATGDCEIDGIGDERGGFYGHPMCKFCQRRYYGENELYHHMSVDHYLCHICHRLNPGQYDYFNNYDDLETHFRHDHSLCEHPDCLAKKFVVFTSEVELKRHNALTHGGNMSRAQRTAALQIPVRFQYYGARNQGRASPSGNSNGHLSTGVHCQNLSNSVGFAAAGCVGDDVSTPESFDQTAESRSRSERSGYITAVGGASQSCLEGSAFPPLPGSKTAKRRAKQHNRGPVVSADGPHTANERRGASIPSSRSQLHGRVEDQSGRSSTRTVSMPNQWQQIPGRDIRTEGGGSNLHMGNRRNFLLGEDGVRGKVPDSESPSPAVGGSDYSVKAMDELRNANKALSDCIRSRLGNNKNIFMAFRDLSAEFRRGDLDVHQYCKHIKSLGLWDLVPELARLCPDSERRKNLLNEYEEDSEREPPIAVSEGHLQMERKFDHDYGGGRGKNAKKAEASELTSVCSAMDAALTLTVDSEGTCSGRDHDKGLLKDNHHKLKGKHGAESSTAQVAPDLESSSGIDAHGSLLANGRVPVNVFCQSTSSTPVVSKMWSCSVCTLENRDFDWACAACGTSRPPQIACADAAAHGKRMKKTSKFERLRVDKDIAPQPPQQPPPVTPQVRDPSQKTGTRGAWRNGGGQRLVALAEREAAIEAAWRRPT